MRVPAGTSARSPRAAADPRAAAAPRPRPPMPPLPPAPAPAGPPTSAAPFAAVPTPERAAAEAAPGPVATALDDRRPPSRAAAAPRPSRSAAVPGLPPRTPATPPAPPLPFTPSAPVWDDDGHDAPWVTGRGAVRAPRVPGRRESSAFVERRASRLPSGGIRPATGPGESPAYGDWTKPSGPGRLAAPEAAPAPVPPVPPAPLTTAIPDREVSGRQRWDAGDLEPREPLDSLEFPAPRDLPDRREAASSTGTGPVVGGRAASRAERQAREEARQAGEAARRKAARRSGAPSLDDDERPRPRRLLTGLVAVGAVAAAILGVHTVITPDAEVAGAQTAATSSAAPRAATSAPAVTAALPPLDTAAPAPATEAAPAAPVRVPVTVLNATTITGLAADISTAIAGNGQGWQTGTPGGYPGTDVAATTVYFTEGDEKQRQAALQLVEQFPQLRGPAVRFFEVPPEVAAPGLVVVATGDWKP